VTVALLFQLKEYSAVPVREPGSELGVTSAVEEKGRGVGIALPTKEKIHKRITPDIKRSLLFISPPFLPSISSVFYLISDPECTALKRMSQNQSKNPPFSLWDF